MKDNLFDVENQEMPEAWRDDVKAEGPNIPDIADRINGIVSNAHYQVDRSEENMNRYRSRVIEMIENTAKSYHQSKLQALKEEVENRKGKHLTKHKEYSPTSTTGIEYEARIDELKEVLNLITNLEDNGH